MWSRAAQYKEKTMNFFRKIGDAIYSAIVFVVRQTLALIAGTLLLIGTVVGSLLAGFLVAFFLFLIGFSISVAVALAPLLGKAGKDKLNELKKHLDGLGDGAKATVHELRPKPGA